MNPEYLQGGKGFDVLTTPIQTTSPGSSGNNFTHPPQINTLSNTASWKDFGDFSDLRNIPLAKRKCVAV
jgi:hypothetical protein